MAGFLIGVLAREAGVSAPTVRYYEEVGLLPPSSRTSGGYRRYTDAAIRKAQGLGFSLDEIREILKLSRAGEAPCGEVLTLARRHLEAVDSRIAQLQRFREHLAGELAKWDGQQSPTCGGLCEIIETAEDPPDEWDPQRGRRVGDPERQALSSRKRAR